jgi:signal transduction histidine kinase
VPWRVVKAERLLSKARLINVVGFALVLVAVLAVAIGIIWSRAADAWVAHTLEVQQKTQSFLISTTDAESTLRSFLLAGDPDDLGAFDGALATARSELDELRTLTADNALQQARFKTLDGLFRSKAEQLDKGVALAKDGQRDAALAIINSEEDRELLDDNRDAVASILDTERNLLTERQGSATKLRYALAAVTGLALLSAIILAAILAVSTRQALAGLIARTGELETESKLRQEAETTLRQTYKMEAVGQLTGGIAHDFNNLLTIILGNLDKMKRSIAEASNPDVAAECLGKLEKPLDAAQQGAERAAKLTHRLLAFSRRQALEPQRLEVNRLISGMLELLNRSVGAETSIEAVFGAGVWPIFADANQLENVILNLALNARDAMPNGGCLTIETANTYLDDAYVRQFGDVNAGQYVVLCVTDTGTGIPKDLLDRVFEPFFTTKATGAGSGLGLAMVHGFVKQSGGHMRIYSEEEHGTTVKIYLPRLSKAEEIKAVPAGKVVAEPLIAGATNGETILLVEDNLRRELLRPFSQSCRPWRPPSRVGRTHKRDWSCFRFNSTWCRTPFSRVRPHHLLVQARLVVWTGRWIRRGFQPWT